MTRRDMLRRCSTGFGLMALSGLMAQKGYGAVRPARAPRARARRSRAGEPGTQSRAESGTERPGPPGTRHSDCELPDTMVFN